MADQVTQDLEHLQQLLQMFCKVFGLPAHVADELFQKYKKDYREDPSLRSIIKHIQKGGKVNTIEIDPSQIESFKTLLQERHIDYHEMSVTREGGDLSSIFLFKDKDMMEVSLLMKALKDEISQNAKELDIHEFKQLMSGRQIGVADHLSVHDLAAFRNNVKDTDLKYVVLKDNEEKYKIYVSNPEKLTEVMLKSSYDIAANNDGFISKIDDYINKKNAFYDRVDKKEPFVIVDKDNPNNFIFVDKSGYSVHSIQDEEITTPEGIKQKRLFDAVTPKKYDLDKQRLFDKANSYRNPVVLSVDDFKLLDKVDKQGKAYMSQDFPEKFIELKERLKHTSPSIDKTPKTKSRYSKENLVGYSSLPTKLVKQMKKDLPFIHTNDVDQIAFTKQEKATVDRYLEENILGPLKEQDPLKYIAFSLKLQGKTGEFMPDFEGKNGEFFVCNHENRNKVLSIDEDGAHFLENGKEYEMIPVTDPGYKQRLYDILEDHNDLFVMTKAEMSSNRREEISKDRFYCENSVTEKMLNIDKIEKEELVNCKNNYEDKDLSDTQKKALFEMEKKQVVVRTFDTPVWTELQDQSRLKEHSQTVEL